MEKTKKVADMTSKEIDEYLKKFLDEYNATHEDVEDTEDDVDEYEDEDYTFVGFYSRYGW